MRDVADWLEDLGLGEFARTFAENRIDFRTLPELTGEDLREMDIPLGPRKLILKAIGALRADGGAAAGTAERAAGEAATQGHPAAEAERRQLTVMFVDLVGSTALSGRLDPEDLREVMRRYQDAVAGAVTRYGGHVAKYLGDGVLVYFGWPQAHEDQAERAVRAGLDALAAVGEMTLDGGAALNARAGIATGLVVIGDLVGEAGAVSGETPNLAARLQEVADAGQVAIGEATRHLIGEAFELEEKGARALKGFAEPVPVWRVLGERATESRFEAAHAGRLTTFVGREHEIGLLLERWERAKRGEGQVVLLSGEAGIGKSRITQSLRERIAGEAHTRLRYQCAPYYTSTAFHPFIRQLEFAAGFNSEDGAEAKRDKLEALFAPPTASAAEVVPLFTALLSVASGDRHPPLDMTPQRQKEKTIGAIGDQLLALAAREPLLVIFEDAHWADPTSLEALEQVIDRIQPARVLVLITFRPEFAPPWHGHTHVTALTLNRLGGDQCAAIIEHVTGGKALPGEVLDQIVAKTDGMPLFVEELTKTVVESGLLEEKAESYELTGPLPPLAIPSTLQDSLMARLDRLARVKEVAQVGAAIGREFPHRLLAAVAPSGESELHEALSRLTEAGLIFRRGSATDATYIFKHALVQDAAYESLLRSRRQALHQRIARTLEEEFPERAETEPEIVAHHYTQAGLTDEAITYWLRAGTRAGQASANAEAIQHLNRGLALVETLPESGDRDARELDLRITSINPLIAAVGYSTPELERACARALELCQRTGDASRIFPVLYGRWVVHYAAGLITRCRELAAEYLELAEAQQDRVPRLVGHRIYGSAALINGDNAASRQHLEQALADFDPDEHASLAVGYGQDVGAAILSYLPTNLCLLGFPDQAAARGREAMARARSVDHTNTLAYTLWHVGTWLHWLLRDAEGLAASTEELLTLAAEPPMPIWRAGGMPFRGVVLAANGEPEQGLAEIDEALASGEALKFALLRPLWDLMRGQILHDLERIDAAWQAMERSETTVAAHGEHWIEAELHRVGGEFHRAQGAKGEAEAEAAFTAAIAIARGQEAKWWELRAAVSLARLWHDQGKTTEARDLLRPVHDWFSEGFDTPDLKDAKALLEELS